MKFTKEQIKKIESELDSIDMESLHKDMLNDCYGEVNVAGYTYNTAYILELIDSIAFRESFLDFIDSMEKEIIEVNEKYYFLNEVNDLELESEPEND